MADKAPLQTPRGEDGMQKGSSWVALFKDNRKLENGFRLKKWTEKEWEIEEDDLCSSEEAWGICIVGYILGRYPGRKAVDELRNSWGVKHLFYVHSSGWMVFKFESQEDKEKVLSGGPYSTFGTPWLLKSLPPFFKFGDDGLNFIPTWIQLPSLPMECWNEIVLRKIVSQVGIPISSDQCTAQRSRPGFARVLVEVDINKPLVKEIVFRLPNGEEIHQQVMFERAPIMCNSCKRIGHMTKDCRKDRVKDGKRSLSRRPGVKPQVEKSLAKGRVEKVNDVTQEERSRQVGKGKEVVLGEPSCPRETTKNTSANKEMTKEGVDKEKIMQKGTNRDTSAIKGMNKEGVDKDMMGPMGTTRAKSDDKETTKEGVNKDEVVNSARRGRSMSRRRTLRDDIHEGTTLITTRPCSLIAKEKPTQDVERENKGKMVVELIEGMAPQKILNETASSNSRQGRMGVDSHTKVEEIFKLPPILVNGKDQEEEEESVGNGSHISRRDDSPFLDMATKAELSELKEADQKKKDKKRGRPKYKGRVRQK